MSWARRDVMLGGAALLTFLHGARIEAAPRFSDYPFKLGIASGEPVPDGFVIWTRLAPDPFGERSGMAAEPVAVAWQVAEDEGFAKVVATGTAIADPGLGHSVHVEVTGLKPHRHYWYRFRAGSEVSPAGRVRTAPALGAKLDALRLGVVCCQKYEHGYYTGFRHMSAEDFDIVLHIGDYIYEKEGKGGQVRMHHGIDCENLVQYRDRYAQYKLDADLRAAHEAHAWAVAFDDHEFTNDYAGAIEGNPGGKDEFQVARRTAAYQAYYENMPLRAASMPRGPAMQIYRRLRYGNLLDIYMLDTRQYRTAQPCYGLKQTERCDGVFDVKARMLGSAQEKWLFNGLDTATSRWNVLAQQVIVAPRQIRPGKYSMDKWDGYELPRKRLIDKLAARPHADTVILSGDNHRHYVADIHEKPEDPDTRKVATEFSDGSIASRGDGKPMTGYGRRILENSPHFKYFSDQRGYLRCTVTPAHWRTDYRIMEYVERRGAPIETLASFTTEYGRAGAEKS